MHIISHKRIYNCKASYSVSAPPEDILESGKEELLNEQKRYVLIAGSSVILISK
jgi:hypothetical protein